ncbi:MAG: glycosyltransferase, partial [bacterium]
NIFLPIIIQNIGKKILLWRNHPMGSYLTKLAVLWSDQVFCTSKQSFTARYSKTQIMPVGIDTDFFTKQVMDQKPNSIVVVSRISPIKNIHLIIEALKILAVDGVKFTADFYGDCLPKDKEYCSQILNRVSEAGMTDFVRFNAAIPNHKTPEIYSSHEVFINATPSGSLDKTIFEAGACETFVITSNQSLSDVLPKESVFMENDPENLAQNIKNYFSLSSDHKSILVKQIHDFVLEKHSLKKLVKMIS